MKLNADDLAFTAYRYEPIGLEAIARQHGRREGYAAAITEVAQPLQDRVEELEAALKAMQLRLQNKAAMHVNKGPDGRPQWSMTEFTHEQYCGNWEEMNRMVDAILAKRA